MSTVNVPGFAFAGRHERLTTEELVKNNFPGGIVFLRHNTSQTPHFALIGTCVLTVELMPFEDANAVKVAAVKADLERAEAYADSLKAELSQLIAVV